MTTVWLPRSIECLRGYTATAFGRDAIAGVTVALVAIPLAMAFAIASGVPPQAGMYTAVVAGFIISALGGSRVQIGGPTGAFVVIVAGIVARFGLNGLALVGIMAGIILVILGVTGLGTAVKFIPRPVIVGFTNGIAVLIASTQIKDFFGLRVGNVPGDFVGRLAVLATHFESGSFAALAIACFSLAVIIFWGRITKHVPGSIIALALSTLAVAVWHLPVATIGSTFGGIPQGLPPFHVPHLQANAIVTLLPSALTVAFLAAVESLLSAVVADGMTGDRHKSNLELVAQGLANLASPFFGGIPATGAIARTATNIRSGGTTPVAGMIHAAVLLIVLLVAAPLASYIPLAALAAVLMVVAYHMGAWHEIGSIVRLTKADVAVWITTFGLTVFADLTTAVGVGIALAALLYIYRIVETTTVTTVTADYVEAGRAHNLQDQVIPPNVSIVRIHGPFLFGTTEKLDATDISELGDIVIVRLRNMPAIDATGVHALEQFTDRLHRTGRHVLMCGAREQPLRVLHGSPFLERLGNENLVSDIQTALRRAELLAAAANQALGT